MTPPKIYFDGIEVGYVAIKFIETTVHDCLEDGTEECDSVTGALEHEEGYLSTDYVIKNVINKPDDDPEAKSWPQYQNIKVISFEFKNQFLYYNVYDDSEYVPFSIDKLHKQPTATHMIPVINIESIDIYRDASYRDRYHEEHEKRLKPNRDELRKHIER